MSGASPSRNAFVALALAFAAAAPASAATVIVLNRNLPPQVKVSNTEFDVDERAGSVRLAVELFDDSWEGNLSVESVEVPGLRFDRERQEVLYESGGSVVTCARRKRILWGTTWPATNACRITVKKESRTADAGGGAPTSWVVALVTDEPAKAARLSR